MANRTNNESSKQTVVEEGTKLSGNLVSSCAVLVKGEVDGDLDAPSLRVSETGSVHGKVTVGEIVSEGELSGEFDADLVQVTGVVRPDTLVRTKSLHVKLDSASNKRIELVFGATDAPGAVVNRGSGSSN